jgi:hypothetical protein
VDILIRDRWFGRRGLLLGSALSPNHRTWTAANGRPSVPSLALNTMPTMQTALEICAGVGASVGVS